ncbi:helicase-related protein [Pedobacter cryoconitis]|uniref:helicase-related protein n=1 Tax=Pedobacter cryoconitis TaxID=188932 RepID=UPI001B86B01C
MLRYVNPLTPCLLKYSKSKRFPFAICCTSTLELGIDIGSVEKVVQIDAAHSIASLIQRVGRSGRKDGESSSLLFYATDCRIRLKVRILYFPLQARKTV